MKFDEQIELYSLISRGLEKIPDRQSTLEVRKNAFQQVNTLTKVAFDTRKINQETDFNPRRGLQGYHRSEPFVSDATARKVQAFNKLAGVLEELRSEYGRQPEWQDSYTRVLLSSVHKGLKNTASGDDFSEAQPSMASLDYLSQLMDVRYRLNADQLFAMTEEEIKLAILKKDDNLVKAGKHIYTPSSPLEVTPRDVGNHSYDHMVDRMLNTMVSAMDKSNQNYDQMANQMLNTVANAVSTFTPAKKEDDLTDKLFNVKADENVERTITITIRNEKLENKALKKSSEAKYIIAEDTSWQLWLDDQMNDPECPPRHVPSGFIGAASTEEALKLVDEFGLPSLMDLDHDLGGEDTAMVFLKKIVEKFPEGPIPEWKVHSANPLGKVAINSYLNSWKRSLS